MIHSTPVAEYPVKPSGEQSRIASHAVLFGLGAIVLGVIGFSFGDFALQWQPVSPTLPARQLFSVLSAAMLTIGGGAVLWRKSMTPGALLLFSVFGIWVVALHAPLILAHPLQVAQWNGTCEILALAAAALMLLAKTTNKRSSGIRTIARLAFGVCPLVFALAHVVYAEFTASFVPDWIPFPLFWAYATGIGHAGGGLAILLGVRGRLAAGLLAAMYASFAILVHVPRIIDTPSHANWLGLAITAALSGAAWIIRSAMHNEPVRGAAR
ncbi:MAG: DoxX family protein [Terricaulis sp.]